MLLSHLFQVVTPVVPDIVVALITAGVSFLFTQLVKEVLSVFGVDLSGSAAVVTAAIVGLIVAFLNGLLALIPTGAVPLADELLRLLVLLIGAFGHFGIFRIYKGIKTGR